ncbi:hypothetical protein [Escherichia phage SUSP2]|uniref:Uncharacterized protein n=1 Tax=Escherichia phage SUSP2 TaxID=1718669 RepID=A0A0N9S9H1_9CAUD|nr:hypothetical protein AVU06_gp107 [Escherichia phage SUSP2]ALH47135.1 hypothetical protein [Escherichia phage SUSP2]
MLITEQHWEMIKFTIKTLKGVGMTKEFELERKYLVLSLEDIDNYLSPECRDQLQQIVMSLRHSREFVDGKEPLEGIFVKKSYPFYKDTLQKLEMYVKQINRKEFTMVSLGGQQMLVMEDINPKRVNRGVCIKVTGKEEFIDATYLSHIFEGGSAVLNLNEYHISSHPIKGDQIMLQVRERHNGFTHFFQTTKTSLRAMLKEVM